MNPLHDLWLREKHRLRPFLRTAYFWRRTRIGLPLHWLPVSSKHFGRPKGFYPDGATYAETPAGQAIGARHVPVYPASVLQRRPPQIFGGPLPAKFRERSIAPFLAAGVSIIPSGRHWGFYGGTIITPDDRVLLDVSRDVWQWPGHTVRTRFALPRCRQLTGITASLTTPEAEANYWHWTTELLPRIHLLAAAGFPPERVDHYLVNTTGPRYQKETLAELGIPWEKIVVPSARTHFECETLLIPSMNQCDNDVPTWVVAWLRTLPRAESAPNSTGRRLFLSRADAGFRRLLNEEQVLAALAPYGFEVVKASSVSVAAQRRLFYEAEIVIGPHGSAFTNTVWCRPGTPCIEFMPGDYCDLAFWGMDEAAELPHTVVIGNSEQRRGRQRFADFTVDPQLVQHALAGQITPRDRPPAVG